MSEDKNVKVKGLEGDESILEGLEGDNEWRNAWARLIAYAWMSEANLIDSVADPLKELEKLSNFTPPPGLVLRVQAAADDDLQKKYNERVDAQITDNVIITPVCSNTPRPSTQYGYNSNDIGEGKNGWEHLSRRLPTVVIMTMPPRPKELTSGEKSSVNVDAFALADYECTVKTQPFTC